MRTFVLLLVLIGALHITDADLTDAKLAEIRREAEDHVKNLLGSASARIASDPLEPTPSSLAIEKAISRYESHLLKAAAIEAARTDAAARRRRLLSESSDETEYTNYTTSTARSSLPTYSPTNAQRPKHEVSAPYCSRSNDIAFFADISARLENGIIQTQDPAECCSLCLFRKDCFAWTMRFTVDAFTGCYLIGKKYTREKRDGCVSGVMAPSAAWYPPKTPPPESLPSGSSKYAKALKMSVLFYAAQRSGEISNSDYPIAWRTSSHVNDTVPGGWYDAGNTLKMNYGMATAVNFIAWGMLTFPKSFQTAGATDAYLAQIKVATDYMLACYDVKKKRYIGQIGHPIEDGLYWGRPEDDTETPRELYAWTSDMGASDLLGSTAAAWAAASVVFKSTNGAYSTVLRQQAVSIYQMAKAKEGRYSDYFKAATQSVYPSSSFLDNLAYAAGWLYRATGELHYLYEAETFFKRAYGPDPYKADVFPGYDSLWAPTAVLMRQLRRNGKMVPGIDMYDEYYERFFLPAWVKADGHFGITTTPKGMTYPGWNTYANLQLATTVSMVMMQDASHIRDLSVRAQEMEFAERNINYVLGRSGRSFLVGYGANPPKYYQYGAASCPDVPGICDAQNYFMKAKNAQPVVGAMVGGPAGKKRNPQDPDLWMDDRADWATNSPAVDYQAGLAGALAGLYALSNQVCQ